MLPDSNNVVPKKVKTLMTIIDPRDPDKGILNPEPVEKVLEAPLDSEHPNKWELVERIRKLTGNTSGDRQRKTIRVTVRMPNVAGLPGVSGGAIGATGGTART
ncbi:hypothetical protein B296_00044059 [Ensete ventricosum]|uniref:Uncharacterized protein n=1 Tax=Ensete ventricosum TaxID=4639 RepID=A0A426YU66_ENSVE|nr:hypothetical protein B296_00044059 [Ensete ventricosum]